MIQAVGSMIVVRIVYKEKIGSIYIPEQSKRYNADYRGIVHSVGPDYKYDLKPGDEVMFSRHEGVPMELDGEVYMALKEKYVVGKVENED